MLTGCTVMAFALLTASLLLLDVCCTWAAEQKVGVHAAAQETKTGPETMEKGRSSRKVKVAVLNNFPPFSFEVRVKTIGFTIDYLNLLSQKTGVRFELFSGTWEDNLRKFKQGEVDMITAISYTEDRTAFTRYTTPYYLIPTVVYTLEDSFPYSGVKDLYGKKVGIESDVFYLKYLEKYPSIEVVEVEDTNDLLKRLSFGEIDAVITNINIGNHMIKKHMLKNVKLAGRIDIAGIEDEDLRIGVRKEMTDLHAVIQNGMNRISPNEYNELQDRWVGFTPDEMRNMLMPQEQKLIDKYLKKYGGIRFSSQCDWFPLDFITEENAHSGIAAEILHIISNERNLSFTFHRTDSFEKSIDSLMNGRCDILPAVVPSPALRKKLLFTKPYLSLPLVIATKRDEFFVGALRDLSGKRIGLLDQGNMRDVFANKHSHLDFETVASVEDGLEKVRRKENFAFIGTIPTIAYAVQNHNFYNIKISGKLNEYLPVSAAVRQGNHDLASLMNKLLEGVSLEKREAAVHRWVSLSLEEEVDYRILWRIIGVLAIIAAVVAVWMKKAHTYNRKISEANRLLAEKNKELEQISITNQLTGLFNRSKLDRELMLEHERSCRYQRPFSIIMLDVDHFKSINDRFGHQAGDTVLKEISAILKERIRTSDIPGRWGGEEFLIICPETELPGARRLAEDIRHYIEQHAFSVDTSLTISGGAAELYENEDTETLLRRADNNLYAAKSEGRNRIWAS